MLSLNPFFFVLFSIFIVGLLIGGVWTYRKFFCRRFVNEDGSIYYAELNNEYKPLINAEVEV